MLKLSGMTDTAIAQAKKAIRDFEQTCAVNGTKPNGVGLAAVIARIAKKNQVTEETVKAHLYPTWSDDQLEHFSALFDRVAHSMEHAQISEWCRQTGVSMEYACEQLDIDMPEPEAKKKRIRAKAQGVVTKKTPSPKLRSKEVSNGPHNSAMVSGTG